MKKGKGVLQEGMTGLYLACLSIYIIAFTFICEGELHQYFKFFTWQDYLILLKVLHILLIVKILYDVFQDVRMLPVVAAAGAVGYLVFRHNPEDFFLSALWFLCAGRGVKPKATVRTLFWSHLFSLAVLAALCVSGVLSFGAMVKQGHTAVSYSLGLAHPNMLAVKTLQLVLLFWLMTEGRMKKLWYVFLAGVTAAVQLFTECRTVVVLMILLLICSVLLENGRLWSFLSRKRRLLGRIHIGVYLGMTGGSILFFWLNRGKDFGYGNTIFSRITEAIKYFRHYGITLWGSPVITHNTAPEQAEAAGLYTLDNGYMYLLLGFGAVMFVCFLFLQAGTLRWLYERRKFCWIVAYSEFFLMGFVETQVIRTSMNFTLFFLFGFIWEWLERKREWKNECGKTGKKFWKGCI